MTQKETLLRMINDAIQTLNNTDHGYGDVTDTLDYVRTEVKKWTDSLSYTELIYEVSVLMEEKTMAHGVLYNLIKTNLLENENES